MKKVDLHLHSYYSDGRLAPRELVLEAKKAGLEVIALTDHENVWGIPEAIQTGREIGLRVLPGIEFSTTDSDGAEQHLLGLFIDHQNPELANFLEIWKQTKVQQIKEMVKGLQEKGFKVDFEDVVRQAKGYLSRPHIGHAIFENKENAVLLEQSGIKTMSDFFNSRLSAGPSGTSYVERKRPSVKEVIGLTKKIGGMSVWAHPFWKSQGIVEIERKCRLFQEFGLAGIEVCYNRLFSTEEKASGLHHIAQTLGLYETAGSDFHSFAMPKFNKLANFDTFGLELRLPPGIEEM